MMDNINKPYYIVTNKDNIVVNIFFPVLNKPHITKDF